MTDLQMFLLNNNVAEIKKEVVISDRLKNFPFTISCVTGKQLEDYQRRCVKNPNNPKKREFDASMFNELMIINHCVNPNFKDAEWMQSAGCPTDSRALLYKTLTGGEITNLVLEIEKLSGFSNEDLDEIKEETKNS